MTIARRGRFITLEGPDGSGKTTAARHLAEWLRMGGLTVLLTQEPGGTPLGEEVRRLVLHHRGLADDLDPRADALLFAAQRAQHVARTIRPALDRGAWVVCARYLDSSLAYQGVAFCEKVRLAYRDLAVAEPERFRVLDGPGSVEGVDEAIRAVVQPLRSE